MRFYNACEWDNDIGKNICYYDVVAGSGFHLQKGVGNQITIVKGVVRRRNMIHCHIFSSNFESDFVNVNCSGVLSAEFQSGN